jgi:2-polyprenyl-3-methyl-5-hydroxy-6-metoxy-1,4-benzoquinol methylase
MSSLFDNVLRAVRFLCQGQFRRVWNEVHVRIYRVVYEFIWILIRPIRRRGRPVPLGALGVETKHSVAFESPDHIVPFGTAANNSTNKKFILHMDQKLRRERQETTLRCLDLGCSGGQMVKDFLDLGWIAAGLEGSDYSLKRRRANWAKLASTNLFTCDITKPFQMRLDGRPVKFHLITAWEVMEHIATPDLDALFCNIRDHLEEGGYFIASTTSTPDIQGGIELHQTKWENHEWRAFIEKNYPGLEFVDVGLKIYQFVRYNFLHPSHLLYRKRAATPENQDRSGNRGGYG